MKIYVDKKPQSCVDCYFKDTKQYINGKYLVDEKGTYIGNEFISKTINYSEKTICMLTKMEINNLVERKCAPTNCPLEAIRDVSEKQINCILV